MAEAPLWPATGPGPINWARTDLRMAGRIEIVRVPGPLDLVDATARLVRFPAGMWYGPADKAVRILEQRSCYRLFRTNGACYRTKVEAPPQSEE